MNTVYVVMIRVGNVEEIASIFDSKSKAEHYIQTYKSMLSDDVYLWINTWEVR